MEMKKLKIYIFLSAIIVLTIMLGTFKYEEGKKSETFLFEEKLASLKLNLMFAEKEGNKEEIAKEGKILREACERLIKNIFVSKKTKKKAKMILSEINLKQGKIEDAIEICDKLLKENKKDKEILRRL